MAIARSSSPGLQELMQENYASGQLQFTDNVKAAVKDAEVVFLASARRPSPTAPST